MIDNIALLAYDVKQNQIKPIYMSDKKPKLSAGGRYTPDSGTNVAVNVRIPREALEKWEAVANANFMTKSQFLTKLLMTSLPE